MAVRPNLGRYNGHQRPGPTRPPSPNKESKMARPPRHSEQHVVERLGWLRASVLGANDGVLSTSSLIIGVATAHGTPGSILIAGVAGLVAGAMSMAAGE
jgi:vacuolar iron transporter family protein